MNAPESLVLDTARRLFQALESGPAGPAPTAVAARWAAISETGLDRVLVPEALGGFGADLADALAVMRAAGRFAVEAPVLEGVVARWLLAHAGAPEPSGPTVLATPVGRAAGGAPDVAIPYARTAASACSVVERDGAAALAVFAVDAPRLERGENLAGEPRDRMPLPAGAAVHRLAVGRDRVDGLCALLRAAQMLGAMERALEIAVEHANTREQFGKPVGRFQAVQQMLAVLAGQVAVVAAAVDAATADMRDDRAWIGGALAKARASEAVRAVNGAAHQVTAAMGFTREFPLHRFTRRLWAWRDDFGSEHAWHERIGALALALGARRLWAFVVDPSREASHA